MMFDLGETVRERFGNDCSPDEFRSKDGADKNENWRWTKLLKQQTVETNCVGQSVCLGFWWSPFPVEAVSLRFLWVFITIVNHCPYYIGVLLVWLSWSPCICMSDPLLEMLDEYWIYSFSDPLSLWLFDITGIGLLPKLILAVTYPIVSA